MMNITLITQNQEKKQMTLSELFAQSPKTLLYFYPKDNTPGCSLEAKDFSAEIENFKAMGIQVVGVSKDGEKSHCSFMEKQGLSIPLISDESGVLHEKFGAWGEKKNYGKVFMGTIRSTFLLDNTGTILKEWRNVKATGHVARVMKELSD